MLHYLIIHHTGGSDANPLLDTSNQTFEDVNAYHRSNPNVWLGKFSSLGYALGYHYFIDKTGKLTQARTDTEQAAHTKGYNNNPWDPPENSAIGICLAGNFDATMPTAAQITTLTDFLLRKSKEYDISPDHVVPHRTFATKTCYGHHLADTWAANLITPPPTASCVEEKVEIAELKKQLSWYDQLLNRFFKKN